MVRTLPEDKPVYGVTSLGDKIYLLRPKCVDQVEVYDDISYRLLRCLTVPNIRGFVDITSCKHFLCLYISDSLVDCVHRLDLQGNATQWPVNDVPCGLSVNAIHNLIVTCRRVRKIKEFNPRGEILPDVTLSDDVVNPWHAIQLASGRFIVCHGVPDDPVHRVCKISEDGRRVVESHGGQKGSNIGQYNIPSHLAVDDNEFVFVVDLNNRRVTLLSPTLKLTLKYKRQVVASDQFKWYPTRLCLDVQRRRLYVTDSEWMHGKHTTGRVVVFSV